MSARRTLATTAVLLGWWLVGSARAATQPVAKPAVPVDAIAGILDAFSSHPVVVLGEGPHGNEQGHAFRLALLRDPRFAATVNDVVLECGNSRYQELMDRFVNGADVPEDALRHVWQDTTSVTPACDRPIYEEWYRAVRALNAARPPDRRVRVLLAGAPIDWRRVNTRADVHRWGVANDPYMAGIISKQVIARHRRALLVVGDGHLLGRRARDPIRDQLLINILDRAAAPRRVFAVTSWFSDSAKNQDVGAWPAPSLAMLPGTITGEKPFALFYQPPPAPGWSGLRMEDEFDAILYLGPASSMTISHLPASLCADKAYMKMRLARMALDVPQVVRARTDALIQGCARLLGR